MRRPRELSPCPLGEGIQDTVHREALALEVGDQLLSLPHQCAALGEQRGQAGAVHLLLREDRMRSADESGVPDRGAGARLAGFAGSARSGGSGNPQPHVAVARARRNAFWCSGMSLVSGESVPMPFLTRPVRESPDIDPLILPLQHVSGSA